MSSKKPLIIRADNERTRMQELSDEIEKRLLKRQVVPPQWVEEYNLLQVKLLQCQHL